VCRPTSTSRICCLVHRRPAMSTCPNCFTSSSTTTSATHTASGRDTITALTRPGDHVITSGRPRDHTAHWLDVDRPRDAICLATTTHRSMNRRRADSRDDDHHQRNCSTKNGHRQCNGVLTRVKSLDSVRDAVCDAVTDGQQRPPRTRRRRRPGVRRSASTSRCVLSTNNQLTSSVNAPANG